MAWLRISKIPCCGLSGTRVLLGRPLRPTTTELEQRLHIAPAQLRGTAVYLIVPNSTRATKTTVRDNYNIAARPSSNERQNTLHTKTHFENQVQCDFVLAAMCPMQLPDCYSVETECQPSQCAAILRCCNATNSSIGVIRSSCCRRLTAPRLTRRAPRSSVFSPEISVLYSSIAATESLRALSRRQVLLPRQRRGCRPNG